MLAENKIVYRSAVGGLAALAPRTQYFSNIKHISIQEKSDKLKMMLNINHQYTIYMQYALDDFAKFRKHWSRMPLSNINNLNRQIYCIIINASHIAFASLSFYYFNLSLIDPAVEFN